MAASITNPLIITGLKCKFLIHGLFDKSTVSIFNSTAYVVVLGL